MFTNYCLHAGGENRSGKDCYHLFDYLVSNPDDFPQGMVHHYQWKQTSSINNENDVILDEFNRIQNREILHPKKQKRTKHGRLQREPDYYGRLLMFDQVRKMHVRL